LTGLKRSVRSRFRSFGINKLQEIARLVYEISKRDNITYQQVLAGLGDGLLDYARIKAVLLRRRFPYSIRMDEPFKPHLPKLDINPGNAVTIKPHLKIYPKNIYIEETVSGSWLAGRLKGLFPRARVMGISSLKEFVRGRPAFTVRDYNDRKDNFFVTGERYDFFKHCPCTRAAAPCGYHIFNLGFGCPYECTYCYLQEYTNCPGIVLPANIDAYFDVFAKYKRPRMRIGTGEFTDSLALDHITQYSIPLVDFFSKNPGITFEFKTKSSNIGNLLGQRHSGNIVVSWSLNPADIIRENEFFAALLEDRLKSALECSRAGYKIGIHLDPIIYYKGWERAYKALVNRLFDALGASKIAWISLGTFRFSPALKPVIENRFPANTILDGELLPGFDAKLRYPAGLRFQLYRRIAGWIGKRAFKGRIYLCMEARTFNSILKNS
jgi:spore photoproduct lyase